MYVCIDFCAFPVFLDNPTSAGSDAAGFVASLLRGTVLREVSMEGWDVHVDMSMCCGSTSCLVWEPTLLFCFAHEQLELQVSAASLRISNISNDSANMI